MQRPNLFHYATSELSQDAFLAWLLAWADAGCAALDFDLHDLGVRFVSALLQLHGRDPIPSEALRVKKVERQLCRVDVVAEINDDLVIAIEDKTGTCLHEGNREALEDLKKRYGDRDVVAVYLKTGDEARLDAVESYGFRPFLRANFLALLRANPSLCGRNAILSDFHAVLEARETDVNAWRHEPVAEWTQKQTPWIGFFEHLRTVFSDLAWGYVANANGGFLGAWWHWQPWKGGAGIYLQITQGPLQFRFTVPNKGPETTVLCREALAALERAKASLPLPITTTRLRPGKTMAFAQIERSAWMAVGAEGRINLPETLDRLQAVARLAEGIPLANGVHPLAA